VLSDGVKVSSGDAKDEELSGDLPDAPAHSSPRPPVVVAGQAARSWRGYLAFAVKPDDAVVVAEG